MATIPPWLSTVEKINAATEDLFSKLYEICDKIGFKENARNSYCEQAHNHLMALMKEMLEEAETKKEDLYKAVNDMIEEVKKLAQELKSETGLNDLDDIPLIDLQLTLQKRLTVLQEMKEQRLNYLEELLEKECEICRALGTEPTGQNDGVPSNEELENFKSYLQHQEAEKNRLENIFKEMRRSIMKNMDELSIIPALDFERLVCNHPDKFVFSASNMLKLREMRDNLKEQLEAAKEKAALKREELVEMWKCLELPEDRCQAFLDKYSGHSVEDIHELNEEIKRCKQIRSENIARYVEKVREQLRKLWDMCRLDEAQRNQFKPYFVQTYTENLLTLHDLEVERLREYYNKNKKIFDLLKERESMWEKARELEQRANDPERLLNRGGQLLAEEKQRKIIQKKLPKIDDQLKELIQKYETVNREPFTIDGMSYNDFLTQSWDNYLEIKESMKKARQAKAKDKSMKKTPTMSTSRRTPATASSLLRPGYASAKVKDDRSPRPNSTMRRLAQSEKARPTLLTSRVRRSGRLPRRLLASSKALNTSNRSAKAAEAKKDAQTTIESVSQYEQFQQHLENREELRSSMLPEQVLKNVRNKNGTKMRTPVKTPVKPLRKNLSVVTPNKTPRTSHMRDQSRSPRLMSTPRLAPTPNNMPIFF